VRTTQGGRLEGDIRIEAAETRWLFTPRTPWQAGEYHLIASSILEDGAGNRVGHPFEVDAIASSKGENQATSIAVPFRLRSRPR
jgi:hypothetical protein